MIHNSPAFSFFCLPKLPLKPPNKLKKKNTQEQKKKDAREREREKKKAAQPRQGDFITHHLLTFFTA